MIIKNDSLHGFLKDCMFNYNQEDERRSCNAHYSMVQLLDDTIHLKLAVDYKVGDNITFEVKERTQLSNLDLLTLYNYTIKEYDDVSVVCVLNGVNTTMK